MSFLDEFKKFAMRGNVVDLAIGVVIGGAFGKIVSSLVTNIIMPPLGVLIGGINFRNLAITLKPADSATNTPAVVLGYGEFIQTVVDFTIIALAIFVAIKVMNRLMNMQEEKTAAEPPKGPTQEELLAEIRDLLKKKK